MYKIIDTHCDTAAEILDKNKKLIDFNGMINVSMMKKYRSYIQFFAAWISKEIHNPKQRAVDILKKAKEEIKENNISLILNSDDLQEALTTDKLGGILAIEDGRALCGELQAVSDFYNYGVRALTLAWNDDNELTAGANNKDKNAGLTDFGKEVVCEMNRLGMIVDVSHLPEKGFYDVLEISKKPVMASHSNCYSLCPHPRNLKDEQIKTLIKNDGILCISIYPDFLEKTPENATLQSVISHINHVIMLNGANNVGLGSDFDGISRTMKDMRCASDYKKLFEEMKKSGFSDVLIDKIAYKNFLEFYKKIG